jgi:hypothetical protein
MSGAFVLLFTQLTVPGALLWLGHGYRKRSPASKSFFWGGILGYVASLAVVTTLLLFPPVFWGSSGGLRWLAIQWTPLILPLVPATVAALVNAGDRPEQD